MKPGWYKIECNHRSSKFNGSVVHIQAHQIYTDEYVDLEDDLKWAEHTVFLRDLGLTDEDFSIASGDVIYLGSGKFIEESKILFEHLGHTII